ncbi:MAG: energy transducer TonB [Rhodospirillales bacterium]
MRKGFAHSILFHTMVIVVGYFGLPELRRDLSMVEAPIVVEIVTVAETTNAPALKPEPKRQPSPKAEAPPPPAPEPEPEVAAVPPPPETQPKPKLKLKPKPPPKPKAKPRPQAPPRLVKAKPKRKPKPPDTFVSVLKTVKELQRQKSKPKEKSEKDKNKEESSKFEQQTAKALASLSRRYDTSRPLTISEIDLVRQQIARCWNLPAGAKDAENLVIEIWVAMNPDGTVRQARIQQQERMLTDSFFRAAAESALRAVLNKRCQPFKLPRKKYDRWKTLTLVFNPKEMFGA